MSDRNAETQESNSNKPKIFKTALITALVTLFLPILYSEFKEILIKDSSIGFKVFFAFNDILFEKNKAIISKPSDNKQDGIFIWIIKADKVFDNVELNIVSNSAPIKHGHTSVTHELISNNKKKATLLKDNNSFKISNMKVLSNTPYVFAFEHQALPPIKVNAARIETENYITQKNKIYYPFVFGSDKKMIKELYLLTSREMVFNKSMWFAFGCVLGFIVSLFFKRIRAITL